MGVKITGSPPNKGKYKRYASGTTVSGGTLTAFTNSSGTLVSTEYPLTLSGLIFPDGIAQITIRDASSNHQIFYNHVPMFQSDNYISRSANQTQTLWKLTGNAYVTNNGFQMPVPSNVNSYTWEAWGN